MITVEVPDVKSVGSVSDLIPEIRPTVLHTTLISGFVAMLVLCSKPLALVPLTRVRGGWLDALTKTILDVGVLQAASLVILVYCYGAYAAHITKRSRLTLCVSYAVGFSLLTFATVIIDLVFLKPSFRYNPPLASLPECTITSYVMARLGISLGEGTSAPSDFAFRQTIILLSFLLISHQQKWREVVRSRAMNRVLYATQYGLFFLVLAIRFYRGRHSLFDIGVAVGIGVMFFWFVALVLVSFFRPTAANQAYLTESAMPLGSYSIAILFYCQETAWWIWYTLGMFVVMGLLRHFIQSRNGHAYAITRN